MKSVTMVNFLRVQRWPSYAALELHPRRLITEAQNEFMTTGDDGEVYILFQATHHLWQVMRGTRVVWELHKDFISPGALQGCPTFAVVGTTMYFSCNAGLGVGYDGKPTDIIYFHDGTPRKIIGANGKVYVLTYKEIRVIDGHRCEHLKYMDDAQWGDMAIDGDLIYGATCDGLVVFDKGIITPITGPPGKIDIFNGVLYCAKGAAVYARVGGSFVQMVLHAGVKNFTVVEQAICIATEYAIFVYTDKGHMLRISCPHARKIWGSASTLYAIDHHGNVMKYI